MTTSKQRVAAVTAEIERHAGSVLARGRDADSCASVARGLVGAIDAEFAEQTAGGAAIACAPGCAFCCHLRVGAFTHEAIALLDHVRTKLPAGRAAEIERRILDNARRI